MAKTLELIQIIEAGRNAISDIIRGRQIKDQAATDEVHTAAIASLRKELEGLKSGGAVGGSEVARVMEQVSRDMIQFVQSLTSKDSKLTQSQMETAMADFKSLSEKRLAKAEEIDDARKNQSPEAKARAQAKAEAEAEAEIVEAKARVERAKRRTRKEAQEEKNDKIEKFIWLSIAFVVLGPLAYGAFWLFCKLAGFPFGVVKWGVAAAAFILLAVKVLKIASENGEKIAALSEKAGAVVDHLPVVPSWVKRLGIAGGLYVAALAGLYFFTFTPDSWLVGGSVAYWLGFGALLWRKK